MKSGDLFRLQLINLMLNYAWNEKFYDDDDGDDKIPSLEVGRSVHLR